MTVQQIMKEIENLSDEDKKTALAALSSPEPSEPPAEDSTPESEAKAADEVADAAVVEKAEEVASDIKEDGEKGEPGEEVTKDEDALAEAIVEDKEVDAEVQEEAAETAEAPPIIDDSAGIPKMTRDAAPAEEFMEEAAASAPPIVDTQGEELPVDYQQIIDGLNAKIMAIEAENKQLKAKTEGAFGLAGRPAAFGRSNPLYSDDTSDIPRMRKTQ